MLSKALVSPIDLPPYGGELINLFPSHDRRIALVRTSKAWRSLELTGRQLCDLELLLNGAFSPLRGFLSRADYESVCVSMRLADGTLWPIPIVLDVTEQIAVRLRAGQTLVLRDSEGVVLAALTVQELWRPDRYAEAQAIFGTCDSKHPGVEQFLNSTNSWYVSGVLEGIQSPIHYDFQQLRATPAELRMKFRQLGWSRVIAFQTRNLIHRAHVDLLSLSAQQESAKILIHPSVGTIESSDANHYVRVRCYRAVLKYFPENSALFSLLPLATRLAGAREAILHGIIRRNYGCRGLVLDRDELTSREDLSNMNFYNGHEFRQFSREHQQELGFPLIASDELVDMRKRRRRVPQGTITKEQTLDLSETDPRRLSDEGKDKLEWLTFPEVAAELKRTYSKRSEQGFAMFLTGLSGAGKSTIAKALLSKLLEIGGRYVALLDGDLVRKHLSSELSFSREHRNLNIRRIGYVASEIVKSGGIAICSAIAPYDESRKDVRTSIGTSAGFALVYVSTSLAICEERDPKGLYAKARAGMIEHFTGISDPYEEPLDAEITIDTTLVPASDAATIILSHFARLGFLPTCKEIDFPKTVHARM